MHNTVSEIKARTKLSELISRVTKLKRMSGERYLGLCPFHKEKTPSFNVNDLKGYYKCFGCGAKGDAIEFVMSYEGYTYKDALKKLGDECGIIVEFTQVQEKNKDALEVLQYTAELYHNNLFSKEGTQALSYLKSRKITDDIIYKFKLGYAVKDPGKLEEALLRRFNLKDVLESSVIKQGEYGLYNQFKNRVMFPIKERRGNVIAFGGRVMDDSIPKYLNSSESQFFHKSSSVYGIENLFSSIKDSHNTAIIVEGYIDVISLNVYGIHNAVAPLGTSVTQEQLSLLWNMVDNIVVCMDGDAAGAKAAQRLALSSIEHMTPDKRLYFIDISQNLAKDPDEFIHKYGKKAFIAMIEHKTELSSKIFEILKNEYYNNTPEAKAKLRTEVIKLSESIKNKELGYQYKRHLLNLCYELDRKSYSTNSFKYGSGKYGIGQYPGKGYLSTEESSKYIKLAMHSPKYDYIEIILLTLLSYPNALYDKTCMDDLRSINLESDEYSETASCLLQLLEAEAQDIDNVIISLKKQLADRILHCMPLIQPDSLEAAALIIKNAVIENKIACVREQIQKVTSMLLAGATNVTEQHLLDLKMQEAELMKRFNQ